ncbi:hypothetical protein [Thiolapillus sp.]|uniref:hypothetical protein n=1 Tax=Thiolapillus sp. TaxID=2017437 RepID=UPI003AF94D64
MTRTAGAQIGCQRPSRFWGLGCPKIYHEAEDTLVCFRLHRCRRRLTAGATACTVRASRTKALPEFLPRW